MPCAWAAGVAASSAWVRATVPAQSSSGAYLELTSPRDASLVGVSTPIAEDADLHEMRIEGGVMKMRTVPSLQLPAGKTVSLKPGSYHIMLNGLKRQLKPGDTVPLTLKVVGADNKSQTLVVSAEVRPFNADSEPEHHHHMH